MKCIKQASAH